SHAEPLAHCRGLPRKIGLVDGDGPLNVLKLLAVAAVPAAHVVWNAILDGRIARETRGLICPGDNRCRVDIFCGPARAGCGSRLGAKLRGDDLVIRPKLLLDYACIPNAVQARRIFGVRRHTWACDRNEVAA